MNKNKNSSAKSDLENYIHTQELDRFKKLETLANIGCLEWNLETGDLWWSDQINTIFKIRANNVTPSFQEFIGYIHPDDQINVQKAFEKAASHPEEIKHHARAITANGEETSILLGLQLQADKNMIVGYLQDTNELTKERASLLETLAKYRAIMASAGDAIILMTMNGQILEGNARAAEVLQVPQDQVKTLSVDDIHKKDELEAMLAHYQSMLWGQNDQVEGTIIGRQGRITSMKISGRPIEIGTEQMIVVIMHDITEQKQAQVALKRSERRYRSLVDEAREGILLLNTKGKILAANPKICEATGIKQSILLSKNFNDIADFDLDVSPIELISKSTRQSLHMEGYINHINGDISPTGFNIARYKELGKERYIVTAYDLSHVRAGEEDRLLLQKQLFQAQKQEQLGQLAGSLAHDFNNLLSPILLVSDALIEDAADDSFLKKNLININLAAQRARRLIARILDYNRPEQSEPVRIDLKHELNETLQLLRSSVPHTILIKDNYSKGKYNCLVDPDQFHQVIMNVGTNAAHAIGEENGVIKFEMSIVEITEDSPFIAQYEIPEDRYAKISVSDTGCGIPPEYISEIFEPFFTTKSQTEGSGLGLSVVLRIVNNHGGFIEAHNIENSGACINIYLPLLSTE
ncbi:MAG: PAS domain S-box protein [Methylocystaceae bacterium]|nr:PAS domain S-box protein [Methylocystaceae bacterium]